MIAAAVIIIPLVGMAMCTGAFVATMSNVGKLIPDEYFSAESLLVALTTDDPAIKRDLSGKVVSITGVVRAVEDADSDAPVVILDVAGKDGGIRCSLRSKFKSSAEAPKVGSKVIVIGTVRGVVGDAVEVTECVVLPD